MMKYRSERPGWLGEWRPLGVSNTTCRPLNCLKRDCAIGHKYGADGKVRALFPKGASLKDAVSQPKK
jgi:hypothetical protein